MANISTIRFSGLASKLDTESIVKQAWASGTHESRTILQAEADSQVEARRLP